MSTFFRVQPTTYAAADLLEIENQLSRSYCPGESVRTGVSVCDSREELAEYLAQSGVEFRSDWNLVEVEGYDADEADEDAHLGARLIIPTAVVSVATICDDFELDILAAYDRIYA